MVEEAVKPENHFENVDWILGNHTDELTPWIPVIAARSKANFWLLPCCFFDFFSKWNNDGKSSSQVHNNLLDIHPPDQKSTESRIGPRFSKFCRSCPIRDFQNFVSPGSNRSEVFKISWSWSDLVRDLQFLFRSWSGSRFTIFY